MPSVNRDAVSCPAFVLPRGTLAPLRGISGLKLRVHILVFLLVFGLTPLLLAVVINLPLVLDRTALFYQRAYLQNLRADFRDLDQHLASRHEMIRLLAKLPEPGLILGKQGDADQIDVARARYTGWINQILADQRDITQLLFVDDQGEERFWLTRDPRSQQWRPTSQPPQLPGAEFLDAGLHLDPGAVLVSRIRVDPVAGAADPRQLMTLNLIGPIGGATEPSRGAVVMGIDVGGLAQFYRDTLWVNQDGSYLRPGQAVGGRRPRVSRRRSRRSPASRRSSAKGPSPSGRGRVAVSSCGCRCSRPRTAGPCGWAVRSTPHPWTTSATP